MIDPRITALVKDPLVHFLAAGAVLFAVASTMAPAESGEEPITVTRESLLTHIQYRSKAFEPESAALLLDRLDAAARSQLIADFVREEALVREAKALGLDDGDYVIRQRRVQKAEFLAEASAQVSDPVNVDIAAYYAAQSSRYLSPAAATFTHVFVSAQKRPRAEAAAIAQSLLRKLVTDGASFDDATRYGERFLFHKNYVDRTDDYIRSQLGQTAAAAIFNTATPLDTWSGPFSSEYGEHLVYVTGRTPARLAPLAEIEDLVRADLSEERRQAAIDKAIDAIVAKYRVVEVADVRR
ncbi:MAG: peptidyl-prolyl cis-trans isomerase [Parvularculaceae bacterium]